MLAKPRIRFFIAFMLVVCCSVSAFSQDRVSFFVVAKNAQVDPEFTKSVLGWKYEGEDERLKDALEGFTVYSIAKAPTGNVFFVMANSIGLRESLLTKAGHLFRDGPPDSNSTDETESNETETDETETEEEDDPDIMGEIVLEDNPDSTDDSDPSNDSNDPETSDPSGSSTTTATEHRLRKFYPNDFGNTIPIKENLGLDVTLDYLDYLGLPQAWYYTTGSRNVEIGISDARVDTANLDFKDKVRVFQLSSISGGHGSGVASVAAAQGNNAYGIPGVCYDCGIAATRYGRYKTLDQLVELADAGVKVINCSWVSSTRYPSAQMVVDELFENGTIIVAGAGNKSWKETKGGQKFYYPASYDKVISVSSVMYKYENPRDHIKYEERNGFPYVENARGFVGRTAGFINHDINRELRCYPVSTATLNPEIDLLAPTVGVFRFSKFALENRVEYIGSAATSTSAPFVSGTIGLMYSLYPCLPIDEVESILKITSTNIDHIEANKAFRGNYGAGIVHVGRAVEMVYNLYKESETAYIRDQQFERWNFKITSLSKQVKMEDQKFTGSSTLELTAKNQVVLGPGTVLKPNQEGKVDISIDPMLEKECELQLRDPSILDH